MKLSEYISILLTPLHLNYCRWNFTWDENVTYPIRIEYITPSVPDHAPSLTLMWLTGNRSSFEPIQTLRPTVSEAELKRQSMQAALGSGWSTWWRPSATAHVHLPTGFGVDVGVVDDHSAGNLISGGIVDRCSSEDDCTVRPGPHTYNGSYTKLNMRIRGTSSLPILSVTIESFSSASKAPAIVNSAIAEVVPSISSST